MQHPHVLIHMMALTESPTPSAQLNAHLAPGSVFYRSVLSAEALMQALQAWLLQRTFTA